VLEIALLTFCEQPRTIAEADAKFLPTPTAASLECLRQMGLLQEYANRAGTPVPHRLVLSDLGEKVLEDYQSGALKPVPDPERHPLTREDVKAIGATGELDTDDAPKAKKPAAKPAAKGKKPAKQGVGAAA
jgi:hypothetical protein